MRPNVPDDTAPATDIAPATSLVPTSPQLVDGVLTELGHVLWRQRDLILRLIYRLEVQQLVLASGRSQWIALATEDVDDAIDDVQRQEVGRAALVEDLSGPLGTAPDASLRDLIEAAPAPWDLVLAEHHTEFLRLANAAEEAARSNRDILQQGLVDVRDLLESYGSSPESAYGDRPSGAAAQPAAAVLIDREA